MNKGSLKSLRCQGAPTTGAGTLIAPVARRVRAAAGALALTALTAGLAPAHAQPSEAPPLQSLPALQLKPYLGTWYQVALFPNRFQKQCVSDTTATYSLRDDGRVRVVNRCRVANGQFDEADGQARPTGSVSGPSAAPLLQPAQLAVSFLPAALRWLPVGWGSYWVIQLADDGRYAVVSEPSREYLWVLSRSPKLAPADEAAIRSRLQEQGFGPERLARWQAHAHGNTAP
jgi:apolipoprotein D and lipocalin family protein